MARKNHTQPVDHAHAKRLAKKLYAFSAVIGLLLVAGITYVGLTVAWNNDSVTMHADNQPDAAIAQVKRADNWLPVQAWVTAYNLGTYELSLEAYAPAIEAFERAESKAPTLDPSRDYHGLPSADQPPMCLIRSNHVNAYLLGAEESRATANDHVDSTKEYFEEAGDATTKDSYDQSVSDGQGEKDSALGAFTAARDSYDRAVKLLEEFDCFDQTLAQEAQETVNKLDQRIDAINQLAPPPWEPEEDGSGGDDQTPSGQDDQDQGDSESPEESDSNDPESDAEGDDTTDAPAFFDEDEQGRQEQLQDRNALGDTDREEADAANGSGTPSKKQW